MEYIISTKSFPYSKKVIENIYVSGNYREIGNNLIFEDGFIIPSDNSETTIASADLLGCYNIVNIDKQSGLISINSDKRTIIPIYIYKNNHDFGISNNPWLLAQIFKSDIEIDEASLLSQLIYWVDVNPERTLIKNLSRLKAGEQIEYNTKTRILKSEVNYKFVYEPKENISLDEELEIADEQFTKYFTFIKEQNPDKTAGFGCSGGLDSRLIAHYTNKVGINRQFYVIGDNRPNKILKSVTSIVSNEVAKYYKHEIKQIPYRISWLEQSLLLDIRNHPFFFAQIFLNPINDLPEYDYQLAGDPGAYAYLAEPIMSLDPNLLKQHTDFFLGLRKDAQWGTVDIFRKIAGHLGLKVNQYDENGIVGLKKSMVDKNISSSIIDKARNELYDIIDNAPGCNNIEKWFYIHDNITTRYQYASAYDSMNLKKKFYPLYYPFFYEQIKHFPLSYFRNKFFLKTLLLHVNPEYANIPDQNLNFINIKRNEVARIFNRAELALRGRGLQIRDLMKKKEYQALYKKIYNRPNPIFDKYVDSQKILQSHLPYTYAGSQFLKLKMVADYIYYKDFDSLILMKEYEIV